MRILYISFLFVSMFLLACQSTGGKKNKMYNEALFKQYFELFPQASFKEPGGLLLEKEAFMLYGTDHTDKAAEAFLALYDKHKFKRHKYYAAVSNLAEGNNTLALTQLEELDKEGDFSLVYVHHYYLGLAYMSVGENEKAKAALAKVSPGFQYYKKKADDIIQKLEK